MGLKEFAKVSVDFFCHLIRGKIKGCFVAFVINSCVMNRFSKVAGIQHHQLGTGGYRGEFEKVLATGELQ